MSVIFRALGSRLLARPSIDGRASLLCLHEHVPENLEPVKANDADQIADVKAISKEVIRRERTWVYEPLALLWRRP